MENHTAPGADGPDSGITVDGIPLTEYRDGIYIADVAPSAEVSDHPRSDEAVPSAIWQAHLAEGFTNPADRFDEPAPETPQLPRDHIAFLAEPRISVLLDENKLEAGRVELFDRVVQLAAALSFDYHAALVTELEKYGQDHTVLSKRLTNHLAENELDYPEIQIGDRRLLQQLLGDEAVQEQELDEAGFAVNFQLPKPLAYFWWKTDRRVQSPGAEPGIHGAVAWGDFYRSLAEDVWGSIEQVERDYGVRLERLNDLGDHVPKAYYYVFWATARESSSAG